MKKTFLAVVFSTIISVLFSVLIVFIFGVENDFSSLLYFLIYGSVQIFFPFLFFAVIFEKVMNWLSLGNNNYSKLGYRFCVAFIFLIVFVFLFVIDDLTMSPEIILEQGINYWAMPLVCMMFVSVYLLSVHNSQ